MKNVAKGIALAMSCIALMACSKSGEDSSVDSAEVSTSGIKAEFVTRANGDQTEFFARLKKGSKRVKLTGGDELQIEVDGQTHSLTPLSAPSDSYGLTLDQSIGNEIVGYMFIRPEKISAELSAIKLPELIEISAPLDNGQGLNNPLVVSWDPATKQGEKITLVAYYNCSNSFSDNTVVSSWKKLEKDDGEAEFDFTKVAALDEMEQCTIRLTATRSQKGTIDTEFSGGTNVAEQQVQVSGVELTIR